MATSSIPFRQGVEGDEADGEDCAASASATRFDNVIQLREWS
jgi:hypothetical protein